MGSEHTQVFSVQAESFCDPPKPSDPQMWPAVMSSAVLRDGWMDGRTDPRRSRQQVEGRQAAGTKARGRKSLQREALQEKVEEKVCSLRTFTVPSDPGKLPANTQVKLSFLTSVGTDVL